MTVSQALSIRDLKFRYVAEPNAGGDRSWILEVTSLDLARGEQMLLTGGSGRGKSTLLHLICGLMDPDHGAIQIAGEVLHQRHGAARDLVRGRNIGMIFQNFNLLHGFTAIENVMTAMMFSTIPRGEHRRRAAQLLEHLGIEHPSREPERMSIGQQQRVAVARAVACDPVLVLADEPTASLDPENAQIAIDLIQQVCREKNAALLCVSHDPTMAERFEHRKSLDELASTPEPAVSSE